MIISGKPFNENILIQLTMVDVTKYVPSIGALYLERIMLLFLRYEAGAS
jgi:hypothetical protein